MRPHGSQSLKYLLADLLQEKYAHLGFTNDGVLIKQFLSHIYESKCSWRGNQAYRTKSLPTSTQLLQIQCVLSLRVRFLYFSLISWIQSLLNGFLLGHRYLQVDFPFRYSWKENFLKCFYQNVNVWNPLLSLSSLWFLKLFPTHTYSHIKTSQLTLSYH